MIMKPLLTQSLYRNIIKHMENKTKAIVDFILGQIGSGKLGKDRKIPSEYMLADLFDVNKSTANKAVSILVEQGFLRRLRGKGGTVVEKTSLFPRGRIAVAMRQTFSSFYRKVLEGAQSAVFLRGFSTELYIQPEPLSETELWQTIHESGAKGALSIALPSLEGRKPIPMMAVDIIPDASGANHVVSCNYEGGAMMAEHLLARGHRQIVYITTDEIAHRQERKNGFLDTLARHGLKDLDKRVFRCSTIATDANVMIHEIRERLPETSAIAFSSDIEAYQTSIQLLADGVKIPSEISIAGFGALREFRTPGFTIDSVEQNPFRLGSVAADGLLDIIEGRRESCIERLPVKVVPGNTVATIKRG